MNCHYGSFFSLRRIKLFLLPLVVVSAPIANAEPMRWVDTFIPKTFKVYADHADLTGNQYGCYKFDGRPYLDVADPGFDEKVALIRDAMRRGKQVAIAVELVKDPSQETCRILGVRGY